MVRSFRRKIRVDLREVAIRLRAFRLFLIVFLFVTVIGSILLHFKYGISPLEAYYEAVTLMFFSSSLDYPTGDFFFELMWIGYPMFGLILLADGLTGIGLAIKFGDVTSEEWNEAMSEVMNDHVIVVGIGNLGKRIISHLNETSWDMVMVDIYDDSDSQDLIEQYQLNFRIPLVKGNALRENVLIQAGLERAKALMILIDDDFLNLKIAMQARKINPKIKIIMRMFDIEFGEEISKKLNLQLLSTTKIAVDSFLKALDQLK